LRSGILNARGAAFGALLLIIALLAGQTPGPAAGLTNLALPDVISAGGDHIIKRWDSKGKHTVTIGAHDDTVNGVAFLGSGGTTLVSVGAEGKLKIWNVPGARPTLVQDAKSDVSALAVSPDGKLVATGGSDSRIRLWNAADGKLLSDVPAHADAIRALQFASDSALVSASADKTLRVWNVARSKPNPLEYKSNIVAHDRAVTALALSPDGKTIASVSEDSYLKTWRIESGGLEHRVRAGDGAVLVVAFSPDGRTIATGDESGKIKLFDAAKGTPVAFSGSHDLAVTALAFAPDSKTLISGSEDKTLRYWNTMTGQMLAKVPAHEGAVRAIAVVP
jgi:WD40 repeat protein